MNWQQLQTILWLRWRLSRNQWSRGGAVSAVLTAIAVLVMAVLVIGGSIGGYFGGALGLVKAPPQVVLLVWDIITGAFLFIWMLGVVTEIQRSESIDIGRLLHLPISLKEIFLVNYVASHFSFCIVLFLPVMLGLAAGWVVSKGLGMLLMVPLALTFIFMITAWTYCLRGWLVSLMVNQRRRRAIIVGITTVFIVLSQLPNFYFNVAQKRRRPAAGQTAPPSRGAPSAQNPGKQRLTLPAGLLTAHQYAPPLWLANGAMALATGSVWPALWGSAGALVIGALGLRRAYRSTVRFYQGQPERGAERKKAEPQSTQGRRGNFLEKELPGIPEESAALALATFRSMMRAPEVKLTLATSFIPLVVVGGMLLFRSSAGPPEAVKPLIATGAVVMVFFGLLQLMFNQFGFDRDGFRALVLLPVKRKYILLGKNLGFLPIGLGIGILLLTVVTVTVQVPFMAVLAAIFQLAATFLLVCIAGNFISVAVPFRIAPGSLKPTKMSSKTTLMIFLSHLLFPIVMIPVGIPPTVEMLLKVVGWLPFVPVNLLLSLVLLAGTAFFYRLSLETAGQLLQRREREILLVVTQEVE